MNTAILWFRNDLRVHDNESLVAACQSGKRVLPVFVLPERELQPTALGISKMGIRRLRFLFQSLEVLQKNLGAMGLPLQFAVGDPGKQIVRLAEEYGADEVYMHGESATEEYEDESAIEDSGLTLWSFEGQSLIHPDDLYPSLDKLPGHFTAFRNKMESRWIVRGEFPTPVYGGPAWDLPPTPLPAADDLLPEQADAPKNDFFWGGEDHALARLGYYLEGSRLASTYKETRNGLLGTDFSTRFSTWLANGCISPRRIYHELKSYEARHGANESTYWIVFELLWRDFFRFSAMKSGEDFFRMPRESKLQPSNAFNKWCAGKTAHPFANACMNELRETSFMSNRGRQNAASFLINDLKQPWYLGAMYFEHHLIDYDVYSNYGNWTYLAGVGADPRKDRVFNLNRQAQMYDPDGEYVHQWAYT
jgi:deoxyribodipyrimidine photo-lyase